MSTLFQSVFSIKVTPAYKQDVATIKARSTADMTPHAIAIMYAEIAVVGIQRDVDPKLVDAYLICAMDAKKMTAESIGHV